MASKAINNHLWWVMGLLVMLAPFTLNALLDALEPEADSTAMANAIQRNETSVALPPSLPMTFKTQMLVGHLVQPNGWYQSVYVNQLRNSDEGLVPYIPRLFNLENYTPVRQESRTINGEDYGRVVLRRKFSDRHYIAYYQYQVGDSRTNSYTRAKLYQIPAALQGVQVFTLTIWQRECEAPQCHPQGQALEAWLAEQSG